MAKKAYSTPILVGLMQMELYHFAVNNRLEFAEYFAGKHPDMDKETMSEMFIAYQRYITDESIRLGKEAQKNIETALDNTPELSIVYVQKPVHELYRADIEQAIRRQFGYGDRYVIELSERSLDPTSEVLHVQFQATHPGADTRPVLRKITLQQSLVQIANK